MTIFSKPGENWTLSDTRSVALQLELDPVSFKLSPQDAPKIFEKFTARRPAFSPTGLIEFLETVKPAYKPERADFRSEWFPTFVEVGLFSSATMRPLFFNHETSDWDDHQRRVAEAYLGADFNLRVTIAWVLSRFQRASARLAEEPSKMLEGIEKFLELSDDQQKRTIVWSAAAVRSLILGVVYREFPPPRPFSPSRRSLENWYLRETFRLTLLTSDRPL